MPAAKYTEEATYLLRMDGDDKAAYEAQAQAERLSLADWMNRALRAEVRRAKRREG